MGKIGVKRIKMTYHRHHRRHHNRRHHRHIHLNGKGNGMKRKPWESIESIISSRLNHTSLNIYRHRHYRHMNHLMSMHRNHHRKSRQLRNLFRKARDFPKSVNSKAMCVYHFKSSGAYFPYNLFFLCPTMFAIKHVIWPCILHLNVSFQNIMVKLFSKHKSWGSFVYFFLSLSVRHTGSVRARSFFSF